VTVKLACGAGTLVFRNVPAQICDECGEEFLSRRIARKLLARADRAANAEF
jgi:YgiT-type zinc finger domain-containing protein